jgi:hypothetical protein
MRTRPITEQRALNTCEAPWYYLDSFGLLQEVLSREVVENNPVELVESFHNRWDMGCRQFEMKIKQVILIMANKGRTREPPPMLALMPSLAYKIQ